MGLLGKIRANAKKLNKTIVLAEGTEERTLKAADFVLKEEIAKLILLGDPAVIHEKAAEWTLNHLSEAIIINPKDHPDKMAFTGQLYELRRAKGLTMEQASRLVEDPLYLATLLIRNGKADGEVAGAENNTGDV
ncbi:MAG: phosphate acyltransferase, partial [Bacteroidetes bacterium]|nr:phosphate acyltransferase [Bacteroidota bacterium]